MKCLMIKPKWVTQILNGLKDEEYRTWPTNYRGDFLIGCSSTKFTNAFIAAVAEITDCEYSEKKGVYVWQLANIRPVKPIPIKGQLRLFESGINDYEVITDEEGKAAYDAATWIIKQQKEKRKGV